MLVDRTCDGVDHCAEDGGRLNELFEDVGLCGQRKAVVQHFLQKFIDHYHIVLNGSLCTHSKIVLRTKNTVRIWIFTVSYELCKLVD